MVRADQKPGRRRAVPEPKPRRSRSDRQDRTGVDARDQQDPHEPATSPAPEAVPGPPTLIAPQVTPRVQGAPPAEPKRSLAARLTVRAMKGLWLLTVLAGAAAVATHWMPDLSVPDVVATAGAVTLTTAYAFGLAARTGGRPLLSGGLALALALAAVLSQVPILLAGAAVGTAVLAAVLGVMSTVPAARFVGVVREVLVAVAVAVVGGFAAEAYEAQLSLERTGYLVLGLSLLCALGLVYRLGAGLHGLGKRGLVMIVGGVGLLTVTLAYTEALGQWGSPALIEGIETSVDVVRDTLGAVPRPIEVLLGFPALAWGISTRARRRQGWWVCAFGAAGLAAVTVSMLDPDVSVLESGLTLLYGVVLGLLLGYVVIRADLFLTGPRGRRARRLEEARAHRPEPGRMQPLL